MDSSLLKKIIEGALMAANGPLSAIDLEKLFVESQQRPSRDEIRKALVVLQEDCAERGIELKEVASGYRYQVRSELGEWVSRLWEERPQKYSRALLETLALVAYRQPITRGEIEEVRGVAVSTNIMKTLLEREWVRIVGHKDLPGRPAMYGTTREFLNYFNLKTLDELPTLAELRDLDKLHPELELGHPDKPNDTESQPEKGQESTGVDTQQLASEQADPIESGDADHSTIH